MKQNTTLNKYLALIVTFFCAMTFGYGQTIIGFDFNGLVGNEVSSNSTTTNGFLSTATITRGSGLTADVKANRFNAISWAANDIASAVTGDDYMEFTIAPNSGYQFDITTIVVNIQRSPFGLSGISLRSSIDGYATNIDGEKAIADIDSTTEVITFTVTQANSATAVTYRVYGWAESGVGTGGFEGTGDDITVNGAVTVLGACVGTTIWNGAWSAGAPDLTTNAVLNANYNTATSSFSACSLTVNAPFTLTVDNGDYVEVQNNIVANGNITIKTKGAIVQIDNTGTVTGTGTSTVTKTKTMQNWYSYTYWSSPVLGETIENAFGVTPVDRRFKFNAAQFIDTQTEIGNTNTFIAGPDDIDDNGNDWEGFSTGIMTRGVGYATTASEIVGPGGYPSTENFIFTGDLNNGVITVPLINNSGGAYNDWNFIGNPYPSAINTDLFFAVNTGLVDVIYLWDQATPPDSNNGGTQNSNFSVDDYAMINGTGGTGARGGAGNIPNKYVASGQGFFVEALAAGNVTFNNSIRVKGTTDNDQFFRTSGKKTKKNSNVNKLWTNLTSDNGVFNQVLIGYISGATNNFDGSFYDAPRNLSTGASAILYTNIEGSDKKFAIQGKAQNSINEDEVISLGFKTTIDVATIYTLSIAQLEGDFLSNNTIYIKDNLLNKLHDLKTSDYNFTSQVGEFNERFEIVFNSEALSTDEHIIKDKALSIIEQQNGDVRFKLSGNLAMASIQIIDLQGRVLYNLSASGNSKTYNLSNLSQAPYIAKVALTDGYVITKKAIKRH